jgi:hypothetical protein
MGLRFRAGSSIVVTVNALRCDDLWKNLCDFTLPMLVIEKQSP